LAIAAVVPLFWLLWKLYDLSPIASGLTPFAGQSRLLVLLLAAGVFLLVNLFAQVPLSVLRLLLVGDQKVAATPPCELAQIREGYTILGWPIRQILPQAWLPENQPRVAPDQLPDLPSPSESESTEGPATETVTPPIADLPEELPETASATPTLAEEEDVWGETEEAVEFLEPVAPSSSEVVAQPEPNVEAQPAVAADVMKLSESVTTEPEAVGEASPPAELISTAEPPADALETVFVPREGQAAYEAEAGKPEQPVPVEVEAAPTAGEVPVEGAAHSSSERDAGPAMATAADDLAPSTSSSEPEHLTSVPVEASGQGAIAAEDDNLELLETVEPLAQDTTPLEISASPPLQDTDETPLPEPNSLAPDQQPNGFEDPLEDALLHEIATAEGPRAEDVGVVEEEVARAGEVWGEDQAETALVAGDEWVETVALDLEENWVDEPEIESEEPWAEDLAQPEPLEEQDTENPTI
jgi:hypothetical protein